MQASSLLLLQAGEHFDLSAYYLCTVPFHDTFLRIHNTYMLASAWNLVLETLFELGQAGLDDRSVKSQLKNDDTIRSYFLVLHDIVNVIVEAGQANFAVLTTTTRKSTRLGHDIGSHLLCESSLRRVLQAK